MEARERLVKIGSLSGLRLGLCPPGTPSPGPTAHSPSTAPCLAKLRLRPQLYLWAQLALCVHYPPSHFPPDKLFQNLLNTCASFSFNAGNPSPHRHLAITPVSATAVMLHCPLPPTSDPDPRDHACALDSYSRLLPQPPPALQSLVHLLCPRGPQAEERETAWAPSGICVFLMAHSSLTLLASRTSFTPALRHPVPPRPACLWHLGCLCGRRIPPGAPPSVWSPDKAPGTKASSTAASWSGRPHWPPCR